MSELNQYLSRIERIKELEAEVVNLETRLKAAGIKARRFEDKLEALKTKHATIAERANRFEAFKKIVAIREQNKDSDLRLGMEALAERYGISETKANKLLAEYRASC